MICVEDWAEIRRLHRAEQMPIRAIARHLGISKNTVKRALASDRPPKYERVAKGSVVDGGACSAHDAPGFELGEGAFAGGSESGVVAVELLVVLGLFAVVVVRGAEGGAGALVGAVRGHEDLPGQAGLDDAVGAGRGQVMCAAGCRAGEPQWCGVSAGDDLHVHAVLLAFLRVVRLIGADADGGDQRAVNDDVVALTEAGEGFMEAWGPGGQHLQGLVHVAPGGGLRYREPGAELGERLVLAQVDKREQCLVEAAELPPAGVTRAAVLVQQPGNVLNELMRDVERGRIRNQQGPFGRRCAEWNHHANDEGPCLVTTPTDQPFSPASTG